MSSKIEYKKKYLALGFALLVFGIMYLANSLSYNFPDLSYLLKFWPIIFILWGLDYIFVNPLLKMPISILKGTYFGLLAGVIFFSSHSNFELFNWNISNHSINYINDNDDDEGDTSSTLANKGGNQLDKIDKITNATFNLESAASVLEISSSNDYSYFVDSLNSSMNNDINWCLNDDSSRLDLSVEYSKQKNILNKNKSKNKLLLFEKPVWDMNLEFGAGSLNLDFSRLAIKTMKLSAGASAINLKLSDKYENSNISLETGLSSINIMLPKTVACVISGEMALSNPKFKDFVKDGPTYRSKNFNQAKNKIYLDIESGLSSVNVNWY